MIQTLRSGDGKQFHISEILGEREKKKEKKRPGSDPTTNCSKVMVGLPFSSLQFGHAISLMYSSSGNFLYST